MRAWLTPSVQGEGEEGKSIHFKLDGDRRRSDSRRFVFVPTLHFFPGVMKDRDTSVGKKRNGSKDNDEDALLAPEK